MTSAWGHGLATVASDGTVLDTWFPAPALGEAPAGAAIRPVPAELAAQVGPDAAPRRDRGIRHRDDRHRCRPGIHPGRLPAPAPAEPSARRRRTRSTSTASSASCRSWSGPPPGRCIPDAFARLRPALQRAGISAHGIDKFPRLLDYVVPDRVRIADASRVRLGAHLSPGTTVMHEGFVNYNAGTLGASMVEGRISQGVVVGDGSDVGGGASIMGTLSGGGTERVAIGERALLGANSGIGISIGDDSVVEAGLYVTAGTKVTVLVPGDEPRIVKAVELSGVAGLLFRRNSQTGAVEVLPRSGDGVALNAALHA